MLAFFHNFVLGFLSYNTCHITVVKIDGYQTAFEDVAAILTGIECKYMSLCLVFSILPNFYEIKTNFPQNYNV